MNVLVTDGEHRSALAVTRSLGKKGCNVFVSGKDQRNISSSSRFCIKSYATPDPMSDSENYVHSIREIVGRANIDVVFPMTEQSVYCLNKARTLLGEGVVLACAPSEKMEAVSNKFTLFQLADKLGVPIPETLYVLNAGDFLAKRYQITSFPVVVKPAFSKIDDGGKIISAGVMYADSMAVLNGLYETRPALRYPSLIQELIVGEGTGLFTLFDNDSHLALFSHRRLLEKPPSGGVSVLSESIAIDPEMLESARKLLAEVGWQGIAMVEYKRDVRDGQAKLMEINGRFWGSLQLAVSSGVDFPAICLDYYLGDKPTSPVSDYMVGHRLKWFYGVLDHLVIRMRHPETRLPEGGPSVATIVSQLFDVRSAATSGDVFDLHDIMPAVTESILYLKTICGKA